MDSLRCLIIFSRTLNTWESSSTIRSSTSRCLMAAVIMRMTPSRSFSPERIAAFMSSVIRSLRDIQRPGQPLVRGSSRRRRRRALRRAARAAHILPGQALEMPFHRGSLFSLTLLGGLLVEFTSPELGEDARFFTGTLEATQGGVKILILANSNAGHSNLKCMARPPRFGDRGAHSKVRPHKRQRPRGCEG